MSKLGLQEALSAAIATMTIDLDLEGSASWTPQRNPKSDYSKWGVCEVWLNCRIDKINACTTGPVPTGDWICWNTQTNHIMGFADKEKLTGQQQAEIFAVMQNEGKPTRVVNPFGSVTTSKYTLREVQELLEPALREFNKIHNGG